LYVSNEQEKKILRTKEQSVVVEGKERKRGRIIRTENKEHTMVERTRDKGKKHRTETMERRKCVTSK